MKYFTLIDELDMVSNDFAFLATDRFWSVAFAVGSLGSDMIINIVDEPRLWNVDIISMVISTTLLCLGFNL